MLWEEVTLHIVGLNIDTGHVPLVEGLAAIRIGREQRAQRMAESLAAIGIEGALEGARRYAKNPELVSRSHFARYLVEAGHARDTNAADTCYGGSGSNHRGCRPSARVVTDDS